MIICRQILKTESRVKNQISRHLFSKTEKLPFDFLLKSSICSSIPSQSSNIDSGIKKCIKYRTPLHPNYIDTNKCNCNYWNNFKKSNLHMSPFYNSYHEYDNQKREKREAKIIIAMISCLIIITVFVYSKLDFREYDVPSKKENI